MKIILLLLALGLSGCSAEFSTIRPAMRSVAAIRYTHDIRTGLCFAMIGSQTYYGLTVTSIATVPCDKVPPGLMEAANANH